MYLLEIFRDLCIGVAAGVAASFVYEGLAARRKDRLLKTKFGVFEGEYAEHRRISGPENRPTGGTISLKYLGGRTFSTFATNAKGKKEWSGEFSISDESDILGVGYYLDLDPSKDDHGIHRLVYVQALKEFDVSGFNTSRPDGKQDFKMVWRRKDEGS